MSCIRVRIASGKNPSYFFPVEVRRFKNRRFAADLHHRVAVSSVLQNEGLVGVDPEVMGRQLCDYHVAPIGHSFLVEAAYELISLTAPLIFQISGTMFLLTSRGCSNSVACIWIPHKKRMLASVRKLFPELPKSDNFLNEAHGIQVVIQLTTNAPTTDQLFQQALNDHQNGSIAQAKALYEVVLHSEPSHFDSRHLLGVCLYQLGDNEGALRLIMEAIGLNPIAAPAYINQGNILGSLTRYDDALASYDRAISIQPHAAEAHFNRANTLLALKRFDEALTAYDQAIELKPQYSEAHNNRGTVLQELNRLDAALKSFDDAISLKPDFANAHINRGNVLKDLHRLDEALSSFNNGITLNPLSAEAYVNRGNTLRSLKQYNDALNDYERAISLKNDYAEAHYSRANVLSDLERFEEAISSYDIAVSLKPGFAEAYNGRGLVLQTLQKTDQAIASFDMAISVKQNFAEAHNNRGVALALLKRIDEALDSYERAIEFNAGYSEAYNNIGNALAEVRRFDEAVQKFDQATVLNPGLWQSYVNAGNILRIVKRLDESLSRYDKALAINPSCEWNFGLRLHTAMQLCLWSDLSKNLELLEEKILSGEKSAPPFPVLGLIDNPSLQKCCSEMWAKSQFDRMQKACLERNPRAGEKIRIGYYSADFHDHATLYLAAQLFEVHDRNRVELYAFSFGPKSADQMRQRISKLFDVFYQVDDVSDATVVELSRQQKIDIAVDLKGYTGDARTGIFAGRCAPIQVNFLGYPGTMGAKFIDYIIADSIVIPRANQTFFSECVVRLPHSYQVNDANRTISEQECLREEFDLTRTGFVYCCFNNNWKILPDMFDCWMRILKVVSGSVLWLLEDNPTAANNLRREAAARGVDPQRLVFANRMPLDQHLARHRCADLFLDTLPCNAHTTASDALWAGLPVLTQIGNTFAGRVAASLLNAMNLPELITHSLEEYEAKAIELALNPEKIAVIKAKVASNRENSPLFDAKLFAQHIEAAYAEMIKRYDAGLQPAHIEVNKEGIATSLDE